jgi:hypothetical protein
MPASRLFVVGLLLSGFVCSSCTRKRYGQQPLSAIRMSDPRGVPQLNYGFYHLESNLWRWTGRYFGVYLQPPKGSDRAGAVLTVTLFFPEDAMEELGPVTLRTWSDHCVLGRRTFRKAGSYDYTIEIPPRLCLTNVLPLDFSLDKAIPPRPEDGRELGAVVSYVGLAYR